MSRKYLGNDFEKRRVFSHQWNVDKKLFHQICRPTTGKAQLATVDGLTGCTTRRLVPAELRD